MKSSLGGPCNSIVCSRFFFLRGCVEFFHPGRQCTVAQTQFSDSFRSMYFPPSPFPFFNLYFTPTTPYCLVTNIAPLDLLKAIGYDTTALYKTFSRNPRFAPRADSTRTEAMRGEATAKVTFPTGLLLYQRSRPELRSRYLIPFVLYRTGTSNVRKHYKNGFHTDDWSCRSSEVEVISVDPLSRCYTQRRRQSNFPVDYSSEKESHCQFPCELTNFIIIIFSSLRYNYCTNWCHGGVPYVSKFSLLLESPK